MFSTIDENILANYLTKYMKKNNLTFEFVSQKSKTPIATVKNFCSGKTPNPGILNALPVIYAVGGTPEEMLFGENQDIVKEFSIDSIKEMCEQAIAEMVKTNEVHIANIRTHYEQHRQDYKDHTEHRLADKREIIEQQKEHINTLKKELLTSKIFTATCVLVLVGLLIAEVMNPNLGWLRF